MAFQTAILVGTRTFMIGVILLFCQRHIQFLLILIAFLLLLGLDGGALCAIVNQNEREES